MGHPLLSLLLAARENDDYASDRHSRRQLGAAADSYHPDRNSGALAERIRAGDVAAFEALFRAEYTGLVRFAAGYALPADTAEDVVSDVFTAVWNQRADWHPTNGTRAYLYASVRHRVLNALRNMKRREQLESTLHAQGASPELGTPAVPPDIMVEREDPLRALDRVLAGLSERMRLVLILRWQRQMDFHEIAAVLGTTQATAFNLHARAMRALRQVFPEGYREYLS